MGIRKIKKIWLSEDSQIRVLFFVQKILNDVK